MIEDLLKRGEQVSHADSELEKAVSAYDKKLAKFREKNSKLLSNVRVRASELALVKTSLEDAIEDNRDLFVSPKSRRVEGVQFGLKKGKGKTSWTVTDETLVRRIRKLLPGKVKLLIKVTEKPIKDQLSKLKGHLLKKLGVTISDTKDSPFIKFQNTDAEDAAAAILETGEEL